MNTQGRWELINQVARKTAEGMRAGEIARELQIDPQTVSSIKEQYAGLIIEHTARIRGTRADGTPIKHEEKTRMGALWFENRGRTSRIGGVYLEGGEYAEAAPTLRALGVELASLANSLENAGGA